MLKWYRTRVLHVASTDMINFSIILRMILHKYFGWTIQPLNVVGLRSRGEFQCWTTATSESCSSIVKEIEDSCSWWSNSSSGCQDWCSYPENYKRRVQILHNAHYRSSIKYHHRLWPASSPQCWQGILWDSSCRMTILLG